MSLNYANDRGLRTVKNGSGSAVAQYDILKLDGLVITPTDNSSGYLQKQTFDTTTPTAECDFCITQRAIPSNRFGPALFSGVSPCTINVSDSTHTHAVAGTTTDKLTSATSGPAKILWKESGTGDKNAVVLLSQGSSAITSDLATIYKENDQQFTSTDSGWNQLSDYYFHGVTNSNGQVSPGPPEHAYSDVFDSRPDVGSDHGIRLQEAGTYYGVMAFEVQMSFGQKSTITAGDVTSTFQEPDTLNYAWATTNGASTMDLYAMDYATWQLDLLLTDVENTTYDAASYVVGQYYYQGGGVVSAKTTGSYSEMQNICVPFCFSVPSDEVPIELQPWVKIDTASGWDDSNTQVSFAQQQFGDNGSGGVDFSLSWIRYIPDLFNTYAQGEIANTPP